MPQMCSGTSTPTYSDQRSPESEGVATQLARQLADPKPADARTDSASLAGTRV